MTDFYWDRVCETSTTTGTGDFTLAGAVTGFQTFDDAGAGAFSPFPYLIEAVDTNGLPTGAWEAGYGLLTGSTTLQRLITTASSNSGSLVDFAAGTKRVHVAASAGVLNVRGCTFRLTSNATAQDFTTATAIPWDYRDWSNDPTGGGFFHESITHPSRLTLPDGYDGSLVRLSGQITLTNITAADWVELKIRGDGGSAALGRTTVSVPTTTIGIPIVSKILFAGVANYFELFVQVGADTSVDVVAADSWFQLEVLQ